MTRKKAIITGGISAVVVIIALMIYAIADSGIQKWMCKEGIAALRAKLGTRIAVKDIDVQLFDGEIAFYGFEMDDRNKAPMLKVDTLSISADVWALLHKDIILEEVRMEGVRAMLYKERKDTAANYQFVIDAFKPKKKDKNKKKTNIEMNLEEADFGRMDLSWDIKSERLKGGDTLDVNHLRLKDMHVAIKGEMKKKDTHDFKIFRLNIYEEKSKLQAYLGKGEYRAIGGRNLAIMLSDFKMAYQRKKLAFKSVQLWQNRGKLTLDQAFSLKMEGMHYACNNGKPRKNHNKPNKGFFDAGHLDAVMNMDAEMHYIGKDSISGVLHHVDAVDKGSGLIISHLSTFFNIHDKKADLTMMKIRLPRTHININNVTLGLAQKKNVVVEPCHVTASVGLQDLAKPFSPKLSNFTTPINLDVDVWGDMNNLGLHNINIGTNDRRLRLTAEGDIVNILKKHELTLHFTNIHLSARSGIKEQIIDHFKKKINIKMERQLKAIGDVEFSGRLTIPYKHVAIAGLLMTKYGNVDVDFDINNNTRYLSGVMTGRNLEIGRLMNVNGLGPITAHAQYSFNIASKKKLIELGRNPGKLPIGWMKATINDVSFKGISFTNIQTEMKSNGSIAEGDIFTSFKVFDLYAQFVYKQTATEQWWKVKPHLLKSRKSLAEHQAYQKKKDMKKAEKAAKKAERAAVKEQTKSIFSRIKEQISNIKQSKKNASQPSTDKETAE